jgi:hypothetical protein
MGMNPMAAMGGGNAMASLMGGAGGAGGMGALGGAMGGAGGAGGGMAASRMAQEQTKAKITQNDLMGGGVKGLLDIAEKEIEAVKKLAGGAAGMTGAMGAGGMGAMGGAGAMGALGGLGGAKSPMAGGAAAGGNKQQAMLKQLLTALTAMSKGGQTAGPAGGLNIRA